MDGNENVLKSNPMTKSVLKRVEKEDSSSSPGLSDEDRSEDEDKMAAAIDDLLTYSKVLWFNMNFYKLRNVL